MIKKVAVLPGDGIGPEIVAEAIKVLEYLRWGEGITIDLEYAPVGGAAYDAAGHPLPDSTLRLAKEADAVLLGAVGGPQWEALPRPLRPEQGLLGLREGLRLFANLRPAFLYPSLTDASTLKANIIEGLDMMIVRELTGGIYFGQPRGIRTDDHGKREGFNTEIYREDEIKRIAHTAFLTAQKRSHRLCSVDKANVLESSELWREIIHRVATQYPDVTVSHMYVDNAAMQLVRNPKQFDVMVTTNMFGDILSDCAAMLTGSIGMLPSASLNDQQRGMYEPIHGSAPDIAGQGVANPLATILSVAMMLRYSLALGEVADKIEQAVNTVLERGMRTRDIASPGTKTLSTQAMGDAVVDALKAQ